MIPDITSTLSRIRISSFQMNSFMNGFIKDKEERQLSTFYPILIPTTINIRQHKTAAAATTTTTTTTTTSCLVTQSYLFLIHFISILFFYSSSHEINDINIKININIINLFFPFLPFCSVLFQQPISGSFNSFLFSLLKTIHDCISSSFQLLLLPFLLFLFWLLLFLLLKR